MSRRTFFYLAALPALLVMFSGVLVRPIHLNLHWLKPAASAGSHNQAYLAASILQVTSTPGSGLATPTELSGTETEPPAPARQPQERNPGLVIGGLLIASIIIFGLLRFSKTE